MCTLHAGGPRNGVSTTTDPPPTSDGISSDAATRAPQKSFSLEKPFRELDMPGDARFFDLGIEPAPLPLAAMPHDPSERTRVRGPREEVDDARTRLLRALRSAGYWKLAMAFVLLAIGGELGYAYGRYLPKDAHEARSLIRSAAANVGRPPSDAPASR